MIIDDIKKETTAELLGTKQLEIDDQKSHRVFETVIRKKKKNILPDFFNL